MRNKKLLLPLLCFMGTSVVFVGSYQELSEQVLFCEKIENTLRQAGISGALCGVYVEDLAEGKRLFGKDDDKLLMPASCMKLWTTATALETLTPEYRFKTSVYTDRSASGEVIKKDIVLYGRGDPTLDTGAIKSLAKQLYELGIRKIKGNIVACESYFHTKKLQEKWEVFDTDWYYAPEITSLSINKNALRLTVDPGSGVGVLATTNLEQELSYCSLRNNITTVKGNGIEVDVVRDMANNIFTLYGTITFKGRQVVERIATPNPAKYAGLIFQKELRGLGIVHKGKVVVQNADIKKLSEAAFVESAPLSEIIRTTNKKSNNLYAELLLNSIGKMIARDGENTAKKGLDEIHRLASVVGIRNKIKFDDGCGLSHCSLMSPRHIVQLLRYMNDSPNKNVFYDSLPVAGVDGLSMKRRFKETIGEGNVRAKTGLLSNMGTLCGYAKSRKGKDIAFSVMLNNSVLSARKNRKIVDEIVLAALEMC